MRSRGKPLKVTLPVTNYCENNGSSNKVGICRSLFFCSDLQEIHDCPDGSQGFKMATAIDAMVQDDAEISSGWVSSGGEIYY